MAEFDDSSIDSIFIEKAIELAYKGLGKTMPNPSVGCIIATNRNVLASACSAALGGSHAEYLAIKQLNSLGLSSAELEKATLYVTLEPCCHYGKNPPCTDIIIKSGLRRVVIAVADPYHEVAGKGIAQLNNAGLEVIVGPHSEKAKELMKGFFSRIQKSRPFTTLKLAVSIDGKIALSNGDSKWISSKEQLKKANELRNINDAIMVGIGTVLSDNPMLTYRNDPIEDSAQPMRVILDSKLKIPLEANLCTSAKRFRTVLFALESNFYNKLDFYQQKIKHLSELGIKVLAAPLSSYNESICMQFVLKKLGELGVNDLLVEGGSGIATSLIKQSLIDKMICFISPLIIGNDGIPAFSELGIKSLVDAKKIPIEIFL